METKLKMIYWKGDKFWVGKLLEHPEIMTQGETLEELEENMKECPPGVYLYGTVAATIFIRIQKQARNNLYQDTTKLMRTSQNI